MEGSLAPVMYWAVRTTLCSAFLAVGGRAVAIPGSDATSLDGAAVELFEDLRTQIFSVF